MELTVKGSFHRDVIAFTNTRLLSEIFIAIENVQNSESIAQVKNLKKLKHYQIHYRIKVSTHYRIGIIIRKNKVWFVRFGHRNSFYKKFP
jgi:mRNA interferase RelE/StbE